MLAADRIHPVGRALRDVASAGTVLASTEMIPDQPGGE